MALRQILELGCGALVIPEQVAIPQADQAFDDMDNIVDTRTANLFRAQLDAAGGDGAAVDVRRTLR